MKSWGRNIILLAASVLALTASAAVKLPKPKGTGPEMLLFCGSRPWIANNCRDFLAAAGFKVTLVGPEILNGLGGEPLRKFLHESADKEPPKQDGITPAFAQLDRYKLVVINAMPAKCQREFFTAERIALLQKFVANGGGLLISRDAPFELLGELSPAISTGGKFLPPGAAVVRKSADEKYQFLPEKWETYSAYAPVKAAENSEVIAMIDGDVPYMATKKYGKGKVAFFNDSWQMNGDLIKQFFYWGYGKPVVAALAGDVTGKADFYPAKKLLAMPQLPPRKNHGEISLQVKAPELQIKTFTAVPVVRQSTFRFANGIRVNVAKSGRVNIFFPGAKKAVISSAKVPVPEIYGGSEAFDSDSGEADGEAKRSKKVKMDWVFNKLEARNGGMVAVCYTSAAGAELEWIFQSGEFNINGRVYAGIKDHVVLKNFKGTVERIGCNAKLMGGFTELKTRRMACYSSLRGYGHYDMSGKEKIRLPRWNFFGSGQPFIYMNSQEGILAEFPDRAMSMYAQMEIRKGGKIVNRDFSFLVGRKRNNLTTYGIWHIFSPGAENIENDYLAIWQTVRRHLRQQEGIKSFPIQSRASWGTGRQSWSHRKRVIDAAAELGFKTMRMPYSPCAMEKLDDANHMKDYKYISSKGMLARPWSPGGYLHGKTEQIFKDHPEWFIRNADGSFYGYFKGNYPVADFNNPAFRQWYFALIRRCKAGGMGALYMDMLGAAAELVNYAGNEADPNLKGVLEIFRFLSAENLAFGIEGMNPLAIDNYWYRRFRYTPMAGREFAMISSSLVLKPEDGDTFSLDVFRMAMYNANGRVDLDGWATGFERFPGELAKIRHMGRLLPEIDRTFARFRLPFIQTTDFGTLWTEGDKGALFFYDSVESITLDLPEGWGIEGVKGNTLRNIKPETIINIGKEYAGR